MVISVSWSTSWKLPSDSISESKVDGGTSTSITSSIPSAAKDLGAIAEKQSVKARVRVRTNFPKSVDTKLEPKWPGHFGNMIPTTHCLLSASSMQVQKLTTFARFAGHAITCKHEIQAMTCNDYRTTFEIEIQRKR